MPTSIHRSFATSETRTFADAVREAVDQARSLTRLDHLSADIWKAWGAGGLSDDEAQELAELVAARKALPPPQRPAQRRVGSRPRSPTSMERRRRTAAGGYLPPHLAARFTLGEQAALAVIAREVVKHGACTLALDHVAALAGVSRTTVKRAIRQAEALKILRIEERRISAFRHRPHRITVTSREWSAWLAHRRKGLEFYKEANSGPPRVSEEKEARRAFGAKGFREGGRGEIEPAAQNGPPGCGRSALERAANTRPGAWNGG